MSVHPRRQIVCPMVAGVTSALTTPGVSFQLARSEDSGGCPGEPYS